MSRQEWRVPAVELAPRLLGCRLLRRLDGEVMAGTIVETEAYPGGEDLGSHSSRGKTPRNASIFEAAGRISIYRIYGLHHCLNIVSGPKGSGEAVLIRAIRPEAGLEAMRLRRGASHPVRDLCRGPGRLCEALGLDRSLDGALLGRRSGVWIEPPSGPIGSPVAATPRIGLGEVGEWRSRPWRFLFAAAEWRRWASGSASLLEGGGRSP